MISSLEKNGVIFAGFRLYLEGGLVVPRDIGGVIWGRKGRCILLFNEERKKTPGILKITG